MLGLFVFVDLLCHRLGRGASVFGGCPSRARVLSPPERSNRLGTLIERLPCFEKWGGRCTAAQRRPSRGGHQGLRGLELPAPRLPLARRTAALEAAWPPPPQRNRATAGRVDSALELRLRDLLSHLPFNHVTVEVQGARRSDRGWVIDAEVRWAASAPESTDATDQGIGVSLLVAGLGLPRS